MSEHDRWRTVRSLFERCADLDAVARAAELDAACGDDSGLRAEVEELLALDSRDSAETDGADRWAIGWLDPAIDELIDGVRIGAFRLRRVLATGGSSIVYEAEQDDPQRRVAMKLVRPGGVSDSTIDRLRAEATVLAQLKHPSIAQVYAAGVFDAAPDGERPIRAPWFAMELVEGARPITEHVRGLDRDARCRLFLDVCAAVEHGHGRGVLHCDLKPANVLVDEDGRVKVIDFGIARSRDVPAGAPTGGTWRYASPEQRAGAQDIDVRSDVFSLGVLLRELLESDASRGEVGWVVARATADDVVGRYPTVAALGADVRALLERRPVVAAPGRSFGYRIGKLARRHRLVTGLSVLLVIALVAGAVGAISGWIEAERQRSRAELRAEEANAALSAFEESLLAAMPYHDGPDVTLRQYLDSVAARIRSAIEPAHPLVAARLHRTVGQTLQQLGEPARAVEHLESALAILSAEPEELREPTVLAAIETRLARLCLELDQDKRAADHGAAAIAWAATAGDADDAGVISAGLIRATALGRLGEVGAAVESLRALHERSVRARGAADELSLAVANSLVVTLTAAGRYDEATAAAAEVAASTAALLGPDHPNTLVAEMNHGSTLYLSGDASAAEAVLRDVARRREDRLGAEHPDTAVTRLWLGRALRALGRNDDAVAELDAASASWRARFDESHGTQWEIDLERVVALRAAGQDSRARELLAELQEREQRVGGTSDAVAARLRALERN